MHKRSSLKSVSSQVAFIVNSHRAEERSLRQLLQQRPGLSEVAGVESLGEPRAYLS